MAYYECLGGNDNSGNGTLTISGETPVSVTMADTYSTAASKTNASVSVPYTISIILNSGIIKTKTINSSTKTGTGKITFNNGEIAKAAISAGSTTITSASWENDEDESTIGTTYANCIWAIGSTSSTVTATKDGTVVGAMMAHTAGGTQSTCTIVQNGTTVKTVSVKGANGSSTTYTSSDSVSIECKAGDTFYVTSNLAQNTYCAIAVIAVP